MNKNEVALCTVAIYTKNFRIVKKNYKDEHYFVLEERKTNTMGEFFYIPVYCDEFYFEPELRFSLIKLISELAEMNE